MKYPALNKYFNVNSRFDYIECDYIDGIKDDKGNYVLRPLNEEEKKFLNNFYEETVVTNFTRDPELKALQTKINKLIKDPVVHDLIAQYKAIEEHNIKNKQRIRDLKKLIRKIKTENIEEMNNEISKLKARIEVVRQEKLLYPDSEDHKMFYKENNHRNNCIFNKAKIMNTLTEFSSDVYDEFFYKNNGFTDYEDLLISLIEPEIDEEE